MHRISLPNDFLEGPNNVYLFDDAETTLVDTGFDSPALRETLADGFAAADVAIEDLDRIFLTHYHIDHCGMLPWLVEQSGATVFAHPDDLPLIKGEEAAWESVREQRKVVLEEWALPDEAIEDLTTALIDEESFYGDIPVEPLRDGDAVEIGDVTLQALHTPGHSLGHLAFALSERNEVITGDALLPEYTPNVGGADLRVDEPLARYVRTLEKIEAAEFGRGWPGHHDRIDDPTARARQIRHHHEERALRVLDALASMDRATPWTVSKRLFGELEGVHILHGPGEAAAHLDHLHRSDVIRREGDAYRLTAETADRLATEEPATWPLSV